MASAVTMAISLPSLTQHKPLAGSDDFFNPIRLSPRAIMPSAKSNSNDRFKIRASSFKEKAVTGLTAAAITAALVLPDVAEAAQPGISPSLKNFLLSIVAGGVVLGAIIGVVIGVSNFDPVKRS